MMKSKKNTSKMMMKKKFKGTGTPFKRSMKEAVTMVSMPQG